MTKQILGIVAVLSLIAGVVGAAFGWFSYKTRSPIYTISGSNLVSSSISKYGSLGIMYDNKPVAQVTLTNLRFGNDGRETIREADVAPADPIRVMLPQNVRLLSCEVVGCSRSVIRPRIRWDGNTEPRLEFDFMDRNDWMLVKLLHTGASPDDCRLRGTLMGCPDGIQLLDADTRWRYGVYSAVLGLLGGAAGFLSGRLRGRYFALKDKAIEHLLLVSSYTLVYRPPNGQKEMLFADGGEIIQGRNYNENSWRTFRGKLEFLDENGEVFSRFYFNPDTASFENRGDKDTTCHHKQYMYADALQVGS